MRPFDEINRLERAEWLDHPAAAARSLVQRVLRHQGVKDVLHGVWLGDPLHQFRLDDGCVVHGPATASVPRFETRTAGQSVEARVVPIPGVEAMHDPPPRDLQHEPPVANDADTGVLRQAETARGVHGTPPSAAR